MTMVVIYIYNIFANMQSKHIFLNKTKEFHWQIPEMVGYCLEKNPGSKVKMI